MDRINHIMGHMAPSAQVSANATSATKKPLNVVVTGAAGNIAYSILFMISNGDMLGADQPINLRLLDIPASAGKMEGVVMEIDDCAFPLVSTLIATTDYEVAFKDADICMLVGARPRGPGMVRSDLLKANGAIFEGQGKALDKFASRNVKICVVGNPANTNALIAMTNAPSLSRKCFTAMTRLDQNRAYAQVSKKTSQPLNKMQHVAIFGNHSKTMYPSVRYGSVDGKPMQGAINDEAWLTKDFLNTVQQRGAAIIAARKGSSAASAAKAAVDHMREWVLGTPEGTFSSMAVVTDGNTYGIPSDLIYSFPCICKDGEWKIVEGLPVDAYSRELMDATAAELTEEKAMGLAK